MENLIKAVIIAGTVGFLLWANDLHAKVIRRVPVAEVAESTPSFDYARDVLFDWSAHDQTGLDSVSGVTGTVSGGAWVDGDDGKCWTWTTSGDSITWRTPNILALKFAGMFVVMKTKTDPPTNGAYIRLWSGYPNNRMQLSRNTAGGAIQSQITWAWDGAFNNTNGAYTDNTQKMYGVIKGSDMYHTVNGSVVGTFGSGNPYCYRDLNYYNAGYPRDIILDFQLLAGPGWDGTKVEYDRIFWVNFSSSMTSAEIANRVSGLNTWWQANK